MDDDDWLRLSVVDCDAELSCENVFRDALTESSSEGLSLNVMDALSVSENDSVGDTDMVSVLVCSLDSDTLSSSVGDILSLWVIVASDVRDSEPVAPSCESVKLDVTLSDMLLVRLQDSSSERLNVADSFWVSVSEEECALLPEPLAEKVYVSVGVCVSAPAALAVGGCKSVGL